MANAWSKRGPETALANAFCIESGAIDVPDLLAGLMRGRFQIGAHYAPIVFKSAKEGDVIAHEIINWAAEGLGDLVLGVMRQLEIQNKTFDVVMSGTVLMGNPILQKKMAESIRQEAPSVRFKTLSAPPVTGAVLMGMDHVEKLTAVARNNLLSQAKAQIR